MAFTVQYEPDKGHLIARLTGTLDREVLGQYARAIFEAGRTYNCKKLLNDISQVVMDISISEIFYLPELLESVGIDSTWKRAVLYTADQEKFRFLETRMFNEGHPVKIFRDRDSAVRWLDFGEENP